SWGIVLLSRSSRGLYPPAAHGGANRFDADRADLVFGDLRGRVVGGIREEVRRRVGQLDEGDEEGARAHPLGEAREGLEVAASRRDADRVPSLDAEAARIRRMQGHLE